MNKSIISLIFAIFIVTGLPAQTKPKPKPPVQSETDKMLKEAMKSEDLTRISLIPKKNYTGQKSVVIWLTFLTRL